ncbi:hypothetical protein GWK91_11365 [Virgibacillus sp. MSP4-1]|uniref:CDP-glycerol glycerophosphotransferase family protein n=1 Tax=Virgibacillus sp. MSP4-1 TaxID=2700081 RepID=UPI00039A9EE6|nr:CDP-glycerol glycerophosphotransferase family protein [Virgibacillus sp. MSP4-1]QHS23521.1 hypothetical protein GWK91_11365 [Virgibacillus sp. MSP4-1]
MNMLKRMSKRILRLIRRRNKGTITNISAVGNQIFLNMEGLTNFEDHSFSEKNTELIFTRIKDGLKSKVSIDTLTHNKNSRYFHIGFDISKLNTVASDVESEWNVILVKKGRFSKRTYQLFLSTYLKPVLHTQKVHSNGVIYTPVFKKYGVLYFQQYNITKSKTIKYFINNVSCVKKKEDSFSINGSIDSELLTQIGTVDYISFLMRDRDTGKTNLYSVYWKNSSEWEVVIPFYDFPMKNRILDFYFYLKKEAKDYEFRVKQIEDLNFESEIPYLPHELKGTMAFKPYQTEKFSFSIKEHTETVKLNSLTLRKSQLDSIKIEGSYQSVDHFDVPTEIIFKDRNSGDEEGFPAYITKSIGSHYFTITVNKDFLYDLNYRTYDIYVKYIVEGNKLLVRFKSDQFTLKKDTLREFREKEVLYQAYFYATENNRLSYRMAPASIMTDIHTAEIKEGTLKICGHAEIERKDNQDLLEQELCIVIRNRDTEEEFVFYQDGLDFDTCIPLMALKSLFQKSQDILDLYVRIKDGEYIQERKIGFKQYNYYKDNYLSSTFLKGKEFSTQLFLTLTPYGNVKIETFQQKNEVFDLLRVANQDNDVSRNQVWLIGERPDTAQDTGYHFFKYMRTHHPEIEAYYVIEKGSKDVKNLLSLGNILYIGTREHVEKSLQASVFLCSHDINYILPFKGIEMKNYREGLRVFLQHGVLGRKPVEYHKKYYKYPFHLFIVSSIPEKEMVIDEFGYRQSEVKVTGLSRFDNLHNKETEHKILLIPTWREWLNTSERFFNSEYFQRYISLLQNPQLNDLLNKYKIKLDFYPHYRMQQYLAESNIKLQDNIHLVGLGEVKVQDLLKSSNLMITDYSSVSFDFNFMKKPVLFYHFDFKRFFSKGILRSPNETFLGEIVNSEDILIQKIEEYILNGFKENENIDNQRHQILEYIDKNNSQRIYQEVIKAVKEQQKLI